LKHRQHISSPFGPKENISLQCTYCRTGELEHWLMMEFKESITYLFSGVVAAPLFGFEGVEALPK
jgi:hypothetical protein